MKDVNVTLTLKVKDDASVEDIVECVQVDVYGCVEEVVSVEATEVKTFEFKPSEDDPSDVCML